MEIKIKKKLDRLQDEKFAQNIQTLPNFIRPKNALIVHILIS